jgi:uncharacterized membrane protein
MAEIIIAVFAGGLLAGNILEFIYRSLTTGRVVTPQFINAQMYGVSAVFLYFLFLLDPPLVPVLVSIMLFTTGIEFLVGYGYFKMKGVRLWDYSSYALNYRGIICPRFSLYWLGLAMACYYFVIPRLVEFAAQ